MRFDELLPDHLETAIYGMAAIVRDCTPDTGLKPAHVFQERRMKARACEIMEKACVSDWTHEEKVRQAEVFLDASHRAICRHKKLKAGPGAEPAPVERTKEEHYRHIVLTARWICEHGTPPVRQGEDDDPREEGEGADPR